MECKKCGSTNTVKNGCTSMGQQQYHCRACGVYTGDRARDRVIKMEIVDKLNRERVRSAACPRDGYLGFASGVPIWCGKRCRSVGMCSCMRCASVWS